MIIDTPPPVAVIEIQDQIPLATCPCMHQIPKEKKEHLILHLDINKTLIATDKAANLDSDKVITYSLACFTFDTWDESIEEPISYTEYVKFHKVPNPNHDKKVKKEQYKTISRFLDYLEKNNHPAFEKVQEQFLQAKEKLASMDQTVFPSFYKLLEYLDAENIPYTLVMRTFGSDGPSVASEINETLGIPLIKYSYRMKKGKIETERGFFDLHTFIQFHKEHCLIQDDWKWWFSHGENARYGKPFPLFQEGNIRSLFFDDHAQVLLSQPNKNIVAATLEDGSFKEPHELIENKLLFPVNTVEALLDEEYFIKKVKESLDHQRKL